MIGRVFRGGKLPSFLAALIVVLLATLIWYQLPRLAIGGHLPFVSAASRAWPIVMLFTLWLGYFGGRWLAHNLSGIRISWQPPELKSTMPVSDIQAPSQGENTSSAVTRLLWEDRFRTVLQVLRKGSRKWRFGRHGLYRLPWYVLLGDEAEGKTALMRKSGLTFWHDDSLTVRAQNEAAQWWLATEAVLLEPAGAISLSPDRDKSGIAIWEAMLRRLKRVRRICPINGVIVTINASRLLDGTRAEHAAFAGAIRARIRDMDLAFGICFPIYVVVTHCDRLAGFREFFGELTREERAQVWGVTFDNIAADRIDDGIATFPREFGSLVRQLRERVVDQIQADIELDRRAAIYGFPGEFEGLSLPLTWLLVDAFGASPYSDNALLRGVYFTSAVQDGVTNARSASLFAASLRSTTSPESTTANGGHGYFITRLLREVVFQESGLARMRFGSGTQRVALRKAMLAALICALAGLCVAMMISYNRNQQFVIRAGETDKTLVNLAQRGVALDDLPSMLVLLDTARDSSVNYGARSGNLSWLSHMGLYQGDRVRAIAQARYQSLLRETVQRWLVDRMEQELRNSGLDSARRYDLLRLYLMLADKSHYDARAVLTWTQRNLGGPGLTVVQREDLMSHLRALLDPTLFRADVPIDVALVRQTREVLTNTATAQRLFQAILPQLESSIPDPLSVSQMAGVDAPMVLRRKSGKPFSEGVPGVYTLAGYHRYVELRMAALASLNDSKWVFGKADDTQDTNDMTALKTALDGLYFDQYIAAWDQVVSDIEVRPLPQASDDASTIVKLLAGSDSPLRLFLLAVVKQTTLNDVSRAMTESAGTSAGQLANIGGQSGFNAYAGETLVQDRASVARHFAALHQLLESAEDGGGQFDGVQQGLKELAVFLDAMSAARERGLPPPVDALDKFRQLAVGVPVPLSGMLGSLFTNARSEAFQNEQSRLNNLWRENVVSFWHSALDGRYPFDGQSSVDVTLDDFAHMFGPNGLVNVFFKTNLQQFVDTSTTPWQWRKDAKMLHMSSDTLVFFQHAAAIRDAFFRNESQTPIVQFQLVPHSMDGGITRFALSLSDQTLEYAHDPPRAVALQWPPADGTQIARVEYELVDGDSHGGFSESGPWDFFRLINKGKLIATRPDHFMLSFDLNGKDVELDLNADSVVNPFLLPALTQIRCLEHL